jgi:hypothetical protein
MPKHTLYAYVDGSDLLEIEIALEKKLDDLVKRTSWKCGIPRVVNQREAAAGLQEGDLPLWDIGLNFDLPDVGQEPDGWFSDVERIAGIAGQLHALFDRDFVIGIADTKTGLTEDLFDIDSAAPDLTELRQIIGAGLKG